MAYGSANFVDLDVDPVIRSTGDLFNHNELSSSPLNNELYLQDVDPDVPIHDLRKKSPSLRSLMDNYAETKQQNSNPDKTESEPSPEADLSRLSLYIHMSSLSPVNQFQRESSITTPVPRTSKQPAVATPDGEQSSNNPVNQFPIDSPSADVLPISHDLRKESPSLRNLMDSYAETQQQKSNPNKTESEPSSEAGLSRLSPYSHMSSLSPVNQFQRETSITTPVPRTAKRPASTTSDGEPSWKRVKTRISLPLILNANSGPATVLACPDTGSEENIISLDLAQALGYNVLTSSSQNRTFALANGNIVEAVGEIIAECSFGIETTPADVPMVLAFYVFMKLASPIILGLAFLEQTKTLSKHTERLLRVSRPAYQSIQVCSVGRSRNQLYCCLNNLNVRATPDSGSEVNLMARSFASKRGFHIENAKEVIEFADGTIAVTSGVVRAKLAVLGGSTGHSAFHITDFYLMDELRHDLIVGDDSLDELEIFTKREYTMFSSPDTTGPAELSRIRHLGAVDHMLSWVKKKISLIRRSHRVSISTQVSPNDSLADQRENDRREREEIRIVNLPVDQREGAIAAEALKQAQYDNTAGGP